MRYLISCFMIAVLSLGLVVSEASAKRFGGGRSFGVQRSYSSLFSSNKTQNKSFFGQNTNKSRWGSLLGGALIGGLLASLFMGHGLFSGLMTWLILGSILFFTISILRKKMNPALQTYQRQPYEQPIVQPQAATSSNFSSFSEQPVDFATERFLRNAKVSFIRLQTAYDQKNYQDIKSFTTPEVYAEIKMQLEERGDEINTTEVVQLNAQLLDQSQQALYTMASVRFTGSIKENEDTPTPLDEIWHFHQYKNSNEWVLGGIQQEVYQP